MPKRKKFTLTNFHKHVNSKSQPDTDKLAIDIKGWRVPLAVFSRIYSFLTHHDGMMLQIIAFKCHIPSRA